MAPVILPMRNLSTDNFRKLPGLPQVPVCATAPGQRLLLSHYEHEVKLWRISHLDEVFRADQYADLDDDSKGRELVSRIVLNVWGQVVVITAITPLTNFRTMKTSPLRAFQIHMAGPPGIC